MSPFLSLSNTENISLSYLIERNMGSFLWLYQVHFLLFLLLLSHATSSSSLPYFSPPLSMPIYHPEQSFALLQFKNSFSFPHNNSISFHCDLYHGIQSYAKTNSWIKVQIVVHGMGSHVIKRLLMSLALTLVAVNFKVPSIPIAAFSLFNISSDSTFLTMTSMALNRLLSLVGLRT